MKLIERDGKRLLAEAGVLIPEGVFFPWDETIDPDLSLSFPVYAKAQIIGGHRGKQGLVQRCDDQVELRQQLATWRTQISVPCAGFLCEPEIPHTQEWLVSFSIDRIEGAIRCALSEAGGSEVQVGRSVIVHQPQDLSTLVSDETLLALLHKLFIWFQKSDFLHLEINPLVRRPDGSWMALDAKIELDDAAAARHPEWKECIRLSQIGRPLTTLEHAYQTLFAEAGHRGTLGQYTELEGDIGMILFGGGASLVALDALRRLGMRPANYVEMSGNPEPEQVYQASRLILSKPGLRAVWLAGSFANFTDIQVTTRAVLRAVDELGLHLPVVIRRDGPQAEEALAEAMIFAKEKNIPLRFDRGDQTLDQSAEHLLELLSSYDLATV